MKVGISDLNIVSKAVWADFNRIGTIISYKGKTSRTWKFVWYGHEWTTLTYDEVTKIYAVVDKKVNMLNITARLMG